MADKNDKYPDNVPGKYYVDRECIFCNVCATAAPNNFKISEDGTHDVVYKQPQNEDEESILPEGSIRSNKPQAEEEEFIPPEGSNRIRSNLSDQESDEWDPSPDPNLAAWKF